MESQAQTMTVCTGNIRELQIPNKTDILIYKGYLNGDAGRKI